MGFELIERNIYCLRLPFMDIFTSVFLVRAEEGDLLFDCGSSDADGLTILSALGELGANTDRLKYLFISHAHGDHAGGVDALTKAMPHLTVLAGSDAILKGHPSISVQRIEDGQLLLSCLTVTAIPGHTADSVSLLDNRSRVLISGDCLQQYGVFGSGAWGVNITLPREYLSAIRKLEQMDIASILTAHDFHPLGQLAIGPEAVAKTLDACRHPLSMLARLIEDCPTATDSEIARQFTDCGLPTLGEWVVTALRASEFRASGEEL